MYAGCGMVYYNGARCGVVYNYRRRAAVCNVHGSVVMNHLRFMVHNVLLVVCLWLVRSGLVAAHGVMSVVAALHSHLLAVTTSVGVAAFNAGAVILSVVFSVLLCH